MSLRSSKENYMLKSNHEMEEYLRKINSGGATRPTNSNNQQSSHNNSFVQGSYSVESLHALSQRFQSLGVAGNTPARPPPPIPSNQPEIISFINSSGVMETLVYNPVTKHLHPVYNQDQHNIHPEEFLDNVWLRTFIESGSIQARILKVFANMLTNSNEMIHPRHKSISIHVSKNSDLRILVKGITWFHNANRYSVQIADNNVVFSKRSGPVYKMVYKSKSELTAEGIEPNPGPLHAMVDGEDIVDADILQVIYHFQSISDVYLIPDDNYYTALRITNEEEAEILECLKPVTRPKKYKERKPANPKGERKSKAEYGSDNANNERAKKMKREKDQSKKEEEVHGWKEVEELREKKREQFKFVVVRLVSKYSPDDTEDGYFKLLGHLTKWKRDDVVKFANVAQLVLPDWVSDILMVPT